MKKIITLLAAVVLTVNIYAQSPQKMNYQAVVRDANSILVTNTSVGMRISILQGSATGTSVYIETQTPVTNINGLVSIEIGTGTIVSGNFAAINWASGPYFIKTETDPSGGTSYTIIGTSQLLSVPYALYAETSGNSGAAGATGATGINGIDGATGLTGPTGATGIAGNNGIDGATGIQGIQGLTGATGATGLQGTVGATGATGSQGIAGATGIAGTNGTNGIDGATGVQGNVGLTGPTGANGIDGATGATGSFPTGTNIGDMQYWNGTSWAMLPGGQPGQFLTVSASNIPEWTGTVWQITTTAPSSVTPYAATSGGNISNNTYAPVTSRGVCWSTTPNPVVNYSINNYTSNGTGQGTFTSPISGLTQGVTYYIRAYATSNLGIFYGNEISFNTPVPTIPTLITSSVSSIVAEQALSGGNLTSDGGNTIINWGVCWSTTPGPITSGNHTTDALWGTTFYSTITGLTANTTYYVRAYATNSIGTGYGNEISFTTPVPSLPVLSTSAADYITSNNAVAHWELINDGGSMITSNGVCWNTSSGPLATDSHVNGGNYIGTFSNYLTQLSGSTTYYVRSYATNSVGTAYGNEISFTTNAPILPTIYTNLNSSTLSSAIIQGNIVDDGGATITDRGVCWSISANPTISNNYTSDGTGAGTFTSSITGLSVDNVYHIRTYATNSAGTTYGNEITVSTFPTLGMDYQGGVIGYIFVSSDPGYVAGQTHGLIVGPIQSTTAIWGCSGIVGTSTAMGSGQANTTAIVNFCSTPGIAARVCDDLVSGGYSDWYLPSKTELERVLCYIPSSGSWSSSEVNVSTAYHISRQYYYCTPIINNNFKSVDYSFMPIRSF